MGVFRFKPMPVEGLETTEATADTTSDATAQNTDTQQTSGADTDTAQQTQAQTEKTFTQADVDRIVANRIKSGVKAELKRLSGDGDDKPNVEELQRQLSETKTRAQQIEARESVRDYLSDPVHKLNVKAENVAAIVKLVIPDLEYDDDGKPANLKEAVNAAKSIAPALFANTPVSINANQGRQGTALSGDMNSFIRQAAGHG